METHFLFSSKFKKVGSCSKKIETCIRTELPVIIKRNGKDFYKYIYDGNSLELSCVDCGDVQGNFFDGLSKLYGIIRDFLMPKQVSRNYEEYVKWKFFHRLFSSALQVLATQIQTVCFDNLSLLLAALLNVICKINPRLQAGLPFFVYSVFSAIDLCGIYRSLKHVHLQILTKDRL